LVRGKAVAKFEPDFDSLDLIETTVPGSMTDTVEAIFPNPVRASSWACNGTTLCRAMCDMAHSVYFDGVVSGQPIGIKNTSIVGVFRHNHLRDAKIRYWHTFCYLQVMTASCGSPGRFHGSNTSDFNRPSIAAPQA
jgi:hypothetical protein